MELDRRDFLKFSTAAFAGLALSGCVLEKLIESDEAEGPWPPGPEKWIASVCQQCPGGCGINVRVIDGRAVKIDGLPFHPINRGRLCAVGQAGLQVLYDPDRIKGPMRRIGGRSSSQWQSLSWDEAIQTVAAKLTEIRGRGEPHTVAILAGQPRGRMDGLLARFLEAYGSPNYVRNSCDGTAKAVLLTQGIDTQVGYDLEHSNFILSFGYSLLETGWSPVLAHRTYGYLRQERPGAKAKIVQVEPRLSMTAAKADQWIPINPGTDGALALGLAHVIVREGLYDRKFVEEETFGFEDWRDGDGASHLGFKSVVLKGYRLDEVSTITGVPIDTIIDVPGGVVLAPEVPFTSWPPVEGDSIARKGRSMPRIDHAGTALFPLAHHVVSQVPQSILRGDPYPISALFLYYTNPIYSAPEAVGFAKAFEKVPF